MDNNYNWLADVILGSTDQIARPAREVPDLPMDSPLYKFEKRTGASNGLCNRLEQESLIDQLCPVPLEAQAERDAEHFCPTPKAEPGLDFVKHVLDLGSARLQKRARIASQSARRRGDLRQITEECLSDLLPRTDPEQVADCNLWLDEFSARAEELCSDLMLEASL
jgi:hypothetical protein